MIADYAHCRAGKDFMEILVWRTVICWLVMWLLALITSELNVQDWSLDARYVKMSFVVFGTLGVSFLISLAVGIYGMILLSARGLMWFGGLIF